MTRSYATNPILEAWYATLEAHSDEPAILAADGSVIRTFWDIEVEATKFAAQTSMPDPLVLALQIGNHPSLPAMLLALWRKRVIPVLLDSSLSGEALTRALTAACATTIMRIKDGAIAVERTAPPSQTPDAEFLKLTSGTTGAPKAIRFTSAQLLADCNAVCDTMGLSATDINFGAIPWSHSYGFSNLVTPLLCRGIPVVATEDRLPRALLTALATSRATVFPGLPLFFQKLAALDIPSLPHLRLCISAGAPLPATTARSFREKFGAKLHSFYGSSECGGIAYDASANEVSEGCVGQPMRGVMLDYQGDDPSRIRVRSAAVGLGYFPEDDAALSDGCFTPGDLIRRTPKGIILAGRVSEFINVAGRKLNPAEVEAVIRKCPGVREVVVFGIPSVLRGEEPVACVCGSATVAELQAHITATLPGWQAPRDYWITDTLQVNERGKLSRRALAEAYLRR